MYRALRDALRGHRAAIVIGTDCPVLRPQDLRLAARRLRGAWDAVIAPAEDGGYALIGLKRARKEIFEAIEWGSDAVLRETLLRMKALNFKCNLLRTVWDLDRPADLDRLASLPLRSRRSF